MKKRYLIVLNPIAGGQPKEEIEIFLREHFSAHALQFEFYFTCGKDDREKIREAIENFHPDTVVVIGGDGTLNMVATLLLNKNISLGVIPAGSNNGFASELDLPNDMEDALEVVMNGKTKKVDVLTVNDHYCFHLSGVGFNAQVIKRFDENQIRGNQAYKWLGLKEVINYEPKSYRVETNTEIFAGEAFMIEVTNSKHIGRFAVINPDGEPDDGYFEIIVITPFHLIESPKMVFQLATDQFNLSEHTRIISCNKAVILNPENAAFHIDGEVMEPCREIKIGIINKGLEVIIPAEG